MLLGSFDRGIFYFFDLLLFSSLHRWTLSIGFCLCWFWLELKICFIHSYLTRRMESHTETFFFIATCIVMASEYCKMRFGLSMKKTATICTAIVPHDPLLRGFHFQLSNRVIYSWSIFFSFHLTNNDFSCSKFPNHFLVRIMFDLVVE